MISNQQRENLLNAAVAGRVRVADLIHDGLSVRVSVGSVKIPRWIEDERVMAKAMMSFTLEKAKEAIEELKRQGVSDDAIAAVLAGHAIITSAQEVAA